MDDSKDTVLEILTKRSELEARHHELIDSESKDLQDPASSSGRNTLNVGVANTAPVAEQPSPTNGDPPSRQDPHVHDNHTPSRRDDLEALGFVIAELVIRLCAEANGESKNFEGKGDKIPNYLPWSCESSDDAIGAKKAKEVKNIGH